MKSVSPEQTAPAPHELPAGVGEGLVVGAGEGEGEKPP